MAVFPGRGAQPLRVAVIGSGPSAFYAVEALFKAPDLEVRADMFDRLPTPYGLVRGGVAPDHQKIKSVVKTYEKIAADPGFRFFGNVCLGRDLGVEDLQEHYHQVVYAFGNESDRKMGIPGEDLAGVHSATEFVGWYNAHPDYRDRQFDLRSAHRVAVVGNGNVAMDTTRILAVDPEALAPTDISEVALAELRRSRVAEVVLLGRRGPAQAAFSTKEIQEIAGLENADLVVPPDEAELDPVSAAWLENAPRSAQRNAAFIAEQAGRGEGERERKVRCRFLVSPVEVLGDEGGRVRGIRLQKSELHLDDSGTPRPRGIDVFEELEVQLVFKAVGYRGVPIPGVPFDEGWGVVPNDSGRVLDGRGGKPVPRQYVVGWAKRGPTGLIGTNSPDSKATVAAMLEDLSTGLPDDVESDPEAIVRLLRDRGVDFVSYADWQALDAWEVREGEARGKVRNKLDSVERMMAVIDELRAGS